MVETEISVHEKLRPSSELEARSHPHLQADSPIAVKDLRLRNKEEKVGLAYSLWAEGVVCTVPDKKQSPSKKQKT